MWELEPLPPPHAVQQGRHGDRWEERRLWVSEVLVGYTDWPHLAQVCRVERVVTRKRKTTQEVAYAVTSLPASAVSPKRLLALWRGHWGIENRVHWVRDVTLDEDRCQARMGGVPHVMATLRNLTISLARLKGARNIAAALRSYAAHPSQALALLHECHG